ncbi:MAG: hypothetical protein AVDCRST_MAG01-01-407, partial [uncultured Rubrobacteraceae bacterium]
VPQPGRETDERRQPIPPGLQAVAPKGGALRLHLPLPVPHVRDTAALEERQPEDRLRAVGSRDDLADDGHLFPRHAGDGRRRRRGSGECSVV